MKSFALCVVLWAQACISSALAADIYRDSSSTSLRYGGSIGAGAQYRPTYAQASATGNVDFGGKVALSCSGVDFNSFLRGFDPRELVNELRSTILNGAQSVATMYLLTLAYANPTIASILDMMDQRLAARFGAFASACDATEARRRGDEVGARTMGQAENQCFAQLIEQGRSPTAAYRECSRPSFLASSNLPAVQTATDFLRRYGTVNVNAEMEKMLGLLPDQRITANGLQVRPPRIALTDAKSNVEQRTANAVRQILGGSDPNSIADCPAAAIEAAPTGPADACIPPSAADVIRSQAFLAARALSSGEQEMYAAAIADQASAVNLRGMIVELRRELARLTPKPVAAGDEAPAEEVLNRRDALQKQLATLQADAEALEAAANAKAQLVRTQILTMQRVEQRLASRRAADRVPDRSESPMTLTLRRALGL